MFGPVRPPSLRRLRQRYGRRKATARAVHGLPLHSPLGNSPPQRAMPTGSALGIRVRAAGTQGCIGAKYPISVVTQGTRLVLQTHRDIKLHKYTGSHLPFGPRSSSQPPAEVHPSSLPSFTHSHMRVPLQSPRGPVNTQLAHLGLPSLPTQQTWPSPAPRPRCPLPRAGQSRTDNARSRSTEPRAAREKGPHVTSVGVVAPGPAGAGLAAPGKASTKALMRQGQMLGDAPTPTPIMSPEAARVLARAAVHTQAHP